MAIFYLLPLHWFLRSLLIYALILTQNEAIGQPNPANQQPSLDSTQAYWRLYTDYAARMMRVSFYTSRHRLLYQEKIKDRYIKLSKRTIRLWFLFGQDVPITSQIEVDSIDFTYQIEPMLLIPLVENAFKHGANVIEDPQIHIRLLVKKEALAFTVRNRFDAESTAHTDKNRGIGLANLRARLALLYQNSHTLLITHSNNWFDVSLTLSLS